MELLKRVEAIEKGLDGLPLSDNPSIRSVETKWRKEAKVFLRELTQALGNCSKLDSEKLSKYAFRGKTLGELIDHLDSKGLRFSHPGEQDANLYASIFFIMRFAHQDHEKSSTDNLGSPKTSKTSDGKAVPASTTEVVIPCQEPWPVSVNVKKGQTIHIKASGHWMRQAGGQKRDANDKKFYLQGRLGDGRPFRVGADFQLAVSEDAVLHLGVRDSSDYSNNVGHLRAVLTVTKGPSW
jgi:hypothetical protein